MKTHRLDAISLVFGMTFLALSGWSLATDADPSVLAARWLWPGFLLAVGTVLIVATVGSELRRRSGTPDEPDQPDDVILPPQ